jgi:plastocyanin
MLHAHRLLCRVTTRIEEELPVTRTSGRLAVWLAVGAVVTACGDSSGPDQQPPVVSVEVGNDFFTSVRNGSSNPAVDTVAVNGMVTWTWTERGSHDIVPTGTPSFPGSEEMLEPGSTYSVTFTGPGTYTYLCSVHGPPMVGRVVVQ